MAGFQVFSYGRFWVSTEASATRGFAAVIVQSFESLTATSFNASGGNGV